MAVYSALVWLVVSAHFGFLIYLICGGWWALRWRRAIGLHVLAVLWAIGSVVLGLDCPLTDAEQWARARAGLPALPASGFIDHYVTGVFYPAGDTRGAEAVVLAVVLLSWIAYALTRHRGSGIRPG